VKIVVAIKQSGQLDEDFELSDDGLDVSPDYLDWALNEWDGFAVEEAVQQRDVHGGEVIVISVGGELAEEALRAGLAMGADRGMRVEADEDALADPLAVAALLARAIERLDADLVFTGVQSSDAASGVVGAAAAGLLGLDHVAVVRAVEIEGETVKAERELEGGAIEVLRLPLPALLTIQTGINEPRYATLRAIKQAEQQQLEVVAQAELGPDVPIGAVRLAARVPQETSAELIGGSAPEVAARVAEMVRERIAS
jgi:electron transfer flavoprotein beta subunit